MSNYLRESFFQAKFPGTTEPTPKINIFMGSGTACMPGFDSDSEIVSALTVEISPTYDELGGKSKLAGTISVAFAFKLRINIKGDKNTVIFLYKAP